MIAEDWRCPSCQQGCAYCNGSEGEVPASPEAGSPTPVKVHIKTDGTELAEVVRKFTRRVRNGPDGWRAA